MKKRLLSLWLCLSLLATLLPAAAMDYSAASLDELKARAADPDALVSVTGALTVDEPISLACALRIEDGGTVTVTADGTLSTTGDLEIQPGGSLVCAAGGTVSTTDCFTRVWGSLTVDGAFTNGDHATLEVLGGSLHVNAGGVYENHRHTGVGQNGFFTADTGAVVRNYDYMTGFSDYYDDGTGESRNTGHILSLAPGVYDDSTGSPLSTDINVYSTAGFQKASADTGAFSGVTQLFVCGDVELTDSWGFVCDLRVEGRFDGQGDYVPATLTIAQDTELHIAHQFSIRQGSTVRNSGTVSIHPWLESIGRNGEFLLEGGHFENTASGTFLNYGWASLGGSSGSSFSNAAGGTVIGTLVRQNEFIVQELEGTETYLSGSGDPLCPVGQLSSYTGSFEGLVSRCAVTGVDPAQITESGHPVNSDELDYLAGRVGRLDLNNCALTLTRPAGALTELNLGNATLAVGAGGSLEVSQALNCPAGSAAEILSGGALTVSGEFNGEGMLSVRSGGTLSLLGRFNANPDAQLSVEEGGTLLQTPSLMIFNGNDYFDGSGARGDVWNQHYFALVCPVDTASGDDDPIVLTQSDVTNLLILNPDVLRITPEAEGDGYLFEFLGWGLTQVSLHAQGRDYFAVMESRLPRLGLFSGTVYSQEAYLAQKTYTGADRSFYLLLDDAGDMPADCLDRLELTVDWSPDLADLLVDAEPVVLEDGYGIKLTVKPGVTADFDLRCRLSLDNFGEERWIHLSPDQSGAGGRLVSKWDQMDDRTDSFLRGEFRQHSSVLIYHQDSSGLLTPVSPDTLQADGLMLDTLRQDGYLGLEQTSIGLHSITSTAYPDALALNVLTLLPNPGFYQAPILTEENSLTQLSATGAPVYFTRLGGYSEEEKSLAEVSFSRDGLAVDDIAYQWLPLPGDFNETRYVLNFIPPDHGDYMLTVHVEFGEDWFDEREIPVLTTAATLLVRGLDWLGDAPAVPEGREFETALRDVPGTSDVQLVLRTWDAAGGYTYTPVTALPAVADGGAQLLSIAPIPDHEALTNLGLWRLTLTGWGSTALVCMVSEAEYRLPVVIQLPDLGFYRENRRDQTVFTYEPALRDGDHLWFLLDAEGYTLANWTLNINGVDSPEGVTMDASGMLTFDWTKLEPEFYLEVQTEARLADGEVRYCQKGLYCRNGNTFLGYVEFHLDQEGNMVPHGSWQREMVRSPFEQAVVYGLLTWNEAKADYDVEFVNVDDLVAGPGKTESFFAIRHCMDAPNDYWSYTWADFGSCTLSVTRGDAVYTMPVRIELPKAGFYSAAEASQDAYLSQIDFHSCGDTVFYLVVQLDEGETVLAYNPTLLNQAQNLSVNGLTVTEVSSAPGLAVYRFTLRDFEALDITDPFTPVPISSPWLETELIIGLQGVGSYPTHTGISLNSFEATSRWNSPIRSAPAAEGQVDVLVRLPSCAGVYLAAVYDGGGRMIQSRLLRLDASDGYTRTQVLRGMPEGSTYRLFLLDEGYSPMGVSYYAS